MTKHINAERMFEETSSILDGILLSYNMRSNSDVIMYSKTDIWYSVNENLETGTGMIMFYLIEPGLSKGWVRLSENTLSKMHFHETETEFFRVIHGSLGFTKRDHFTQDILEEGILGPGDTVEFRPKEWHTIYTALEPTYLDITLSNMK